MQVTYWATIAAVVTAAVAFVVTGRRRRLDPIALLLWGGVVATGAVVATAVMVRVIGLGGFGVINVLYRQLVIGVPLAALLIAVRARGRGWRETTGPLGRVALVGALLLAPLGIWMSVVEPNSLVVRQASLAVPELPAGEQVRVGIISDIQIGNTGPGPHERAAIRELMAQNPDVILIAGDVAQSSRRQFDAHLAELRALLGELHAEGGVFVVQGDVDERYELSQLSQGTALRWLSDEVATTMVRDVPVTIGGVDLEFDSSAAHRVADELETRAGGDDVRILLAHRPDAVELVPARDPRTDLVVAGHTHGGQIVLPVVGPLMTLSAVPRPVAAGGLHVMGQRAIFVTSGVGVERNQAPKVRLLDPPSVALVTLTAA